MSARVLILDCSQQLVCRISSDYKYSYWTANTAVINRPVYSQKNKYRQHHGTKPTVTMYILELHGYKTQTTPQIRQCTCRSITFSLKYFTTLYLLNLSPVLLTIVMLVTCILAYLCAILRWLLTQRWPDIVNIHKLQNCQWTMQSLCSDGPVTSVWLQPGHSAECVWNRHSVQLQ